MDREELIARTASAIFVNDVKEAAPHGPLGMDSAKTLASFAWMAAELFVDAKSSEDESGSGEAAKH